MRRGYRNSVDHARVAAEAGEVQPRRRVPEVHPPSVPAAHLDHHQPSQLNQLGQSQICLERLPWRASYNFESRAKSSFRKRWGWSIWCFSEGWWQMRCSPVAASQRSTLPRSPPLTWTTTNSHDQTNSTNVTSQICLEKQPWKASYNFESPSLGAKSPFGKR